MHKLAWVYLVNAALLATHEIDSAYWHEWELFRMPGGIELFLVLNLILLVVVFYGFDRVVRLTRGAKGFSYLLAGFGVFAFVVHTAFLLSGAPQFRSVASIALLSAVFAVSVAQIVAARSTHLCGRRD